MAPPATCILTGTVESPPGTPVEGARVRVRTIALQLLSNGAGAAVNDLETRTDGDGAWALTLARGLHAQIDIEELDLYKDITIPDLSTVDLSALTLYNRGTLTPSTIVSAVGPSMGGDLTGNSPNPRVVGLRGVPIIAGAPANGQAYRYRTASGGFVAEDIPVEAAVQTITAGQGIAVTGTSDDPVVAVANGAVTSAMLAAGAAAANIGGLGGVLAGTLPSPTLADNAVTNVKVDPAAAIAWSKISKVGAVPSDVGAIGVTNIIATINASAEAPKIANAQLQDLAESKVTGLVADLAAKRNTADAIPQADVTGLVAGLAARELTANKGAVSGYAGLDSSGKVPLAQLPATVLADGDKGDVTVAGGGATITVDAKAISYAKMQDVSAPDRVLGAIIAGSPVEIPFGAAIRALADDADAPAMRTTLGLGTASTRNVAAAGDAASTEVVKGDDTRLIDVRPPSAHTHAQADVTGLVAALAAKVDEATVITTTAPLTIDGVAAADLSAPRTLAIAGATTGARGAVRLAGDLAGTADAPTVASVGGQTAANVAAGVALANAATDAATPSAIVKRSAGGSAALDVIGDVTGDVSGTAANITGVAAVANGGTGQTTALAGFDALAPSSAKGDLIGHDGAKSVRVPVGGDGEVLIADATQAAGFRFGGLTGLGGGTVTSVATGNGLQGGPITGSGTVDLKLAAAGGLSKILNTNELGIATGGVADAMLAVAKVPESRVITTTAPLTIDGGASADLSASRTLAVAGATAGARGVIRLAGDLTGAADTPQVATIEGKTATEVAETVDSVQSATAAKVNGTIVLRGGSGAAALDVTGNLTGNVAGNVTGNLAGDVNGGTVAGTIRDEGGAVYDAKAFLAVGDGVTDDSAAFAAAKAAMGASGKVLYLPPGTYKIGAFDASLVGMTIRGAGPGATTILTTATGATGVTLSAANTVLEGVTIAISGVPSGAQLSLLLSGADSLARDIVLTGFLAGFRTTGLRAAVENIVCLSPASGALSVGKLDGNANRLGRFQIGTAAAPLTVTAGIEFTVPTTGLRLGDGDIFVTSPSLTRGLLFNAGGGALADAVFSNVRSISAGADVNHAAFFAEPTSGVRFLGCDLQGAYAGVKVNGVAAQGLRFDDCVIGGASGVSQAGLELYAGDCTLNNTTVTGGTAGKVVMADANGSLFWFGGRIGTGGYAAIDNTSEADVRLYGVTIDDPAGYTSAVFIGPCVTGAVVASADSITLPHRVTVITGVTTINEITFPNGSEPITLIPDGAFTLGTSGNIARSLKASVGIPITLFWRESDLKWYPTLALPLVDSDGTTVTVSGPLAAQRAVEVVVTTASPTAAASRKAFTNEGDLDGAGVTLPTAVAGLEFTFIVQTAQLLTITAGAGDTIRLSENVTGGAGFIRSNLVGSRVTLLAINAANWVATSYSGEWTNGTWWAYDTHAEGGIYWATPAATSNAAATPIKCAGTTAAQGTAVKVTQATTNRLTYTGGPTRNFKAESTVSISAAAATNGKLHLYKNGSLITGATIVRAFADTAITTMAIHALVSLAATDYLELWCETDDGDDLTIQNGVLSLASVD
jgi:hypothetical protein